MQIPELIDTFQSWNSRHRAPATVAFYRTRLKKFREAYNARDFSSLTTLEIDEHLAAVGAGMSDSTRHHDVVALERLQKFAIEHKLLDRPVFGILEKPRVGRRDRIPTPAETAALLAQASPEFRLIYSALRQCGARPGELCRATIADVDRANRVITLKEHKTARKTGQVRRIPIGRKLGELLDQAIGTRTEGPVFLSPTGRAWRVENLSRTYSRLWDLAGLPKDLVLQHDAALHAPGRVVLHLELDGMDPANPRPVSINPAGARMIGKRSGTHVTAIAFPRSFAELAAGDCDWTNASSAVWVVPRIT